jgi:N-acetylneuraminic acid mutarotase
VPPCARSGSKGERYKDSLYFFGGYTKKDGEYFNDLHIFNIGVQNWALVNTSGAPPSPRTDHTVCVFERYLYVFAGYDGKNRFNDLHQINLESAEWHKMEPTGQVPITRFGHTAVTNCDNMYIFGGWDGHDTLDDLYMYSFVSNIWYEIRRTCGASPNQRYRHSCVVYENSLFIFGGVDK